MTTREELLCAIAGLLCKYEKAAVQLLFGDEDTWPPRYSVEAESTH